MDPTLVNARFAKPVDLDMADRLMAAHRYLVTLEENVERGGFGQVVSCRAESLGADCRVINIGLPDAYIEHGDVTALRAMLGIDSDSIISRLEKEGIV